VGVDLSLVIYSFRGKGVIQPEPGRGKSSAPRLFPRQPVENSRENTKAFPFRRFAHPLVVGKVGKGSAVRRDKIGML
jgi:hypothetical protein